METRIRKFKKEDRDAIREIAWKTAFTNTQGKKAHFRDKEILADTLVAYHTDYEPESTFVATLDGEVVGYLTGAIDTVKADKIFVLKIIPGLFVKSIKKWVYGDKATLTFIASYLKGFLRGEFSSPHFSGEYPALMHINVLERARGQKIGQSLIEHYFIYLKKKGVKGVQLGTMSQMATIFFKKMGFKVLFEKKRPSLNYALGGNATYYIFGKKL